ncbi:DnaA ATPase domain-containing protein [Limosilactobacillus secaliphilus]|uniref:DnaA ATPase domain-containing protein n=1 Tax=Limosilactobacillus secaliphilus TaxID=396268 RepID=UPI00070C6C63|nr:DnaA/Hda family protein [Limosilactobacillus secaliphilus]
MKNPFNPKFGIQPTVVLNRDELINQLVADIKELDTPYRTTLIYGTRGIGKTVFMNEVGQRISQDQQWQALHLIIGDNMVERLVDLLYQKFASSISDIKFLPVRATSLLGPAFLVISRHFRVSCSLARVYCDRYENELSYITIILIN